MSKLVDNLCAKISALFLLLLLFAICIAGMLTTLYLYEENYYNLNQFNFYASQSCRQLNREYAVYAFEDYFLYEQAEDKSQWDTYQTAYVHDLLNPETSNFLFDVVNEQKEIVFSTYDENATYGITVACGTYESDGEQFTIIAHIRSPLLPGDDYYQTAYWLEKVFNNRYLILWCSCIGLLLCLALFIFLLTAAGHKRNVSGISLNWQDKIPYDLYLCLAVWLEWMLLRILPYYGGHSLWSTIVGITLIATAMMSVMAAALLTTATRLKSGVLVRNTIIYRILHFIWFLLRKGARSLGIMFGSLPVTGKWLLTTILLFFANFLLFLGVFHHRNNGLWLFLLLVMYLCILRFGSIITIQMHRLFDYCWRLAQGEGEEQLDVSGMYAPLRRHGENLNNIGKGISAAVESSLKSERLKTELITNVSHDIKTPLTSIINYIDLLKKEPQTSQKTTEYLAVLERQSAKLKKLTEDLIEASKASTGNIKVQLRRTNVNELLQQTIAEYQDRFAAAHLETVISSNQDEIFIPADGRLLWRVIDNLLNNVCKYSLSHTRVYFQVTSLQQKVYISIKNISREPLNISADELMERFVRGDASRNSEGSGLGLSIARSLTELQHGSLHLEIDGDLFKAQLVFDQAANWTEDAATQNLEETLRPPNPQ